ncbi:hypothetical protein D3C76_1600260 [compost metagenome]
MSEKAADGLRITGYVCDQTADMKTVKEGHGHLGDMFEQVLSDPGYNVLSHMLQQIILDIGKNKTDDSQPKKDGCELNEKAHTGLAHGQMIIDGDLHQIGL